MTKDTKITKKSVKHEVIHESILDWGKFQESRGIYPHISTKEYLSSSSSKTQKRMKKIVQILNGVDLESKEKLKALKNKLKTDYTTCWYPCSADDFAVIHAIERSEWLPDLFVYTDYLRNEFNLEEGAERRYEYTNSKILSKSELKITPNYKYHVDKTFIDLPDLISEEPIILLLEVGLWHNDSGAFLGNKDVIYFNFENINFLDEILLKQKIKIDFMIKTNEGMAWGGGRRSIKGSYGLFSELGVDYLLTDKHGEHGDVKLYNEMVEKHQLSPKAFKLKGIHNRAHLRGRGTCYNVKYTEESFNVDYLQTLFSKY